MRKLTIKRGKAYAACLAKINVYIVDAMQCDLIINNLPCRKLGAIKNGEEKTFLIDEAPARIIVIIDTLSRNYCNDFYDIPEGVDDIYLSGQTELTPAGGVFRFDGIETPERYLNRINNNNHSATMLIILFIITSIAVVIINRIIMLFF